MGTGFVQRHSRQWLGFFARRGYPEARALAAGVEGAVYLLDGGMVAKVWGRRGAGALRDMQAFYAELRGRGLSFATPEILAVEEVDGVAVTFERRIHGRPLQAGLSSGDEHVCGGAAEALTQVLRELATVGATEAMRRLRVLDEGSALWEGHGCFGEALLGLLERRLSRFGRVLGARVRNLGGKHEALRAWLGELEVPGCTALHGDLFPENVLMDEVGRVSGVLDFGFLSTAGDPRLDAAISGAIFNMYGPHAAFLADEFTRQLAGDLGYAVEVLLLYRAAYAMATSNYFTADGSDGHFAWCVGVLNSRRIEELLG